MRGGKRPGAGRKKGVQNKVNAEMREKILKTHGAPLEIIMNAAKELVDAAGRLGRDEIVVVNERAITRLNLLERAATIAKDAAPYIHPKLSAVELSGPEKDPAQQTINIRLVRPGEVEKH